MPNIEVTPHWEEIRRLAELGTPLPTLAEEYGINVKTLYSRCGKEDWLIPSRLRAKLQFLAAENSREPLLGGKSLSKKSESVLLQTWEERASHIRSLAYETAVKAIEDAKGQIVVETASDLKHAVHVARQATGILDTDQPQVQLSLFAGGMEMGPPVRDIHAESVQSIPAITDNDGFWE